jgi:antitoxin Phd
MKIIQLRDAKSGFSAIVDAAEKGEPTIVTKHGRPAVMVVSYVDGQRLYPSDRPSFAQLLTGMPYALETERDTSTLREIEL